MNLDSLDTLAVNTLRIHSLDMVEEANSGHPGMALGAAPIIWTVYDKVMKHSPHNPRWIDRDRFILSAGHATPLLYSLLHLFDYGLEHSDLCNFRQYQSKTPGHPEVLVTPGVDAETGPLGQGIAMGVGMALAESHLAAKFNRPGYEIIDHYTFVLHGDGCPQEGVASEACSFAGTHKLGKLINIYDRNHITIDGSIELSFTEDVAERYRAYGWQVLHLDDANNIRQLAALIQEAKNERTRPSLIIVESTIGYGSPLAGSNKAHGAPLGQENVQKTKETLAWPDNLEKFAIPPNLQAYMQTKVQELTLREEKWQTLFTEWQRTYPDLAGEWERYFSKDYSSLQQDERLRVQPPQAEASRESSRRVLNILAEALPNFIGGSADLAGSNKTWLETSAARNPANPCGQNIHFGIREFAMSCIMNGLLLHGGFRAFCATFFTFSDYMRSGIRSAALMNLPAIFVFTHDSIGVGEDGPTHQPVEQLASFRAMPNILSFRPADYLETASAYLYALTSARPTLLALSRQNLEQLPLTAKERNVEKGAYIVRDTLEPKVILLASGAEVNLLLQIQEQLQARAIGSRVISMPCMELFLEQDTAYQDYVLPKELTKRFALEAGASQPWYRFVGLEGKVHGIDEFGLSAPADKLFTHFGFTVEQLLDEVLTLLD